jgi:hypothetical protein
MSPAETDLEGVRRQLLGAWSLQRWQIGIDGREPSLPFGPDASGLIVYSADGWMNATIARAGRPALSTASVRHAPAQEQCAAFESYFNYAGPFSLRAIDGVPHVLHEVRFSLNPGFVGTTQLRRIDFDGDRYLSLSADEPVGTGVRRHRLDWRRAPR